MFLDWQIKKLQIYIFITKFSTLSHGTILILKTIEAERLQEEYAYYMSKISVI